MRSIGATVGNTDEMPRDKLWNDTLVGVTTGGGQIVFENAGGLYLPFNIGGGGGTTDQTARDAAEAAQTDADAAQGDADAAQADADANAAAITALPSPRQLSNTTPVQSSTSGASGTSALVSRGDHRHQGDGGGGGGGDDAFGWATEGNTDRIPEAKMAGNLLHTVANVNYNLLRFTEVDGTTHDITINIPATGSIIESMLAMHNTPSNAQVIGWDESNARMYWANAATDQRIVDLINDHNPTAVPGAVTQTGGGDRGSGPKFSWEDHTHQIVGIQLDDIPGTPITTVPNDALLLVETSGGINRKITGANARTSLGGGGGSGVDFDTIPELTTLDLADRVLVGDRSDSFSNKYLEAETYATIIRPEAFHGTDRIASGPSSLNFDSSHFTVTGDNDGVDIQLADVSGGPTVTLIDGDFTLAVGQTTLDGGVAIDADREIAISIYAKGGNRADAVGYWQGPSSTLRGTTTNGPIFIPTGANRRVEARVNNTTDYHFQMAVQSGQTTMEGLFYVRVQERGPQGETGPAGGIGARGATGSRGPTGPAGPAGAIDINGLSALAGNIANGDDLVIYDDSAGANRKVSMPGIGAYTSRLAGFITTTGTPANADYFYFADDSDSDNMKRVTGTNLKTYIGAGGDSAQVTENTRVVEHILDRLADFDLRVSDIDQDERGGHPGERHGRQHADDHQRAD